MSKFERMGQLIKEQRIQKGMTQAELATYLGYNSAQYVSNWERAVCGPPLCTLATLSQVLEISRQHIIALIVEETKAELDICFEERAGLNEKISG